MHDNQELVAGFLDWCEHRKMLSKSTVEAYTHTLKHYLEFADGRPFSGLMPNDVEDFGHRPRRQGAPPAAATARREIVTVRLFHDWASERELAGIRRVSTAVAPKVAGRLPKPIPDDVWKQLWASEMPEHERLWLGLGYFLGLRRIEIVTVPPESVNPEVGEMWFIRKGGSPYPIEYIEMLDALASELPDLAVGSSRWVTQMHETATFRAGNGWPTLWWDVTDSSRHDANRLNKRMVRLLRGAGLPDNAATPHRLRHSCATNLLRAGLAEEVIMDALSHSSIDMTKRYTKVSRPMARWRKENSHDREGCN